MKRLLGFVIWVVGVLIGAVLVGTVAVPETFWSSDASRAAAKALEEHSVYVHPEARAVLDEASARRIVGERDVLVAVFPEREAPQTRALCNEITYEHSTALALVYAGTTGPTICAGDYHEMASEGEVEDWARQILVAADFARDEKGGQDDIRTELTEYVRAYDVAARGDLPWGAVPRSEAKARGDWEEDMFGALCSMASGFFVLFWCAVIAFSRLRDSRDARRARRDARTEAVRPPVPEL